MVTDFAVISTIINQLFVLPFGSPMLGGLVLFAAIVVGMAKFGLGMEAAIVIGSGFLMLISITMFAGVDLIPVVVIVLMAIFAVGILRLWRK